MLCLQIYVRKVPEADISPLFGIESFGVLD